MSKEAKKTNDTELNPNALPRYGNTDFTTIEEEYSFKPLGSGMPEHVTGDIDASDIAYFRSDMEQLGIFKGTAKYRATLKILINTFKGNLE